jgi:hypothetical protein
MPSISATEPDRNSGTGTESGAAPQTILTPWFSSRISPKVASTWSRWSRS